MRQLRVLAHLANSVPGSRIGAFVATHNLLKAIQARGHEIRCVVEARVGDYHHEGIWYHQEDPFLAEYVRHADLVLSISGGTSHGHLAALHGEKPSVLMAHSSSPGFKEGLVRHGAPALVVFNSHSLAEMAGYAGKQVVCRPIVAVADHATTRGDEITLVNLTEEKGAHTFDQLARYMPGRRFLGVEGAYGQQVDVHRANATIIGQTADMRRVVWPRTRILLMPGLLETWGLVGVEAACSGIPVIAHPASGPREALGSAAIYCDRDDLDAWIDAIELLDDPAEYERYSGRAAARAVQLQTETQFDVDRMLEAIEEIL